MIPPLGENCENLEAQDELSLVTSNLDLLSKVHNEISKELDNLENLDDFFPCVTSFLAEIVPFEVLAFYALQEDGLSFELVSCEPKTAKLHLESEVEIQTEEGNFAYALYQTRPILFESKKFGRPLLFQSLATHRKVRGMIVGVLDSTEIQLSYLIEKFFSFFCLSLAQLLDTKELARELKIQSETLEMRVDERTVELAQNQVDLMEANHRISGHLAAIDASRDGMAVMDSSMNFTFTNKAIRQLFLNSESSPYLEQGLEKLIHPKCGNVLKQEILPQLKNGGHWIGEVTCLKENQETIEVELSVTQNASGFVMTIRDIANKKALLAEKEEIKKQLEHDKKLKMIGQLSGGMAHDFNNLLSSVIAYSSMLQTKITDEKQLKWLRNISLAGESGAKLVAKLQSFSKQSQYELTKQSFNYLIEDFLKKSTLLQKNPEIQVLTYLDPDLWVSEVDVVKVNEVLGALSENAVDAMEGKGRLTFKSENYQINVMNRRCHSNLNDGSYVRITIYDSGHGISCDTEKIFEPFFTTKAIGQGSGLGLPMALGIIESHHGEIQVYSRPEEGTSVTLYFPAENILPEEGSDHLDLDNLHKKILVVDDDLLLHDLIRMIFAKKDVELLFAGDAENALVLIEKNLDLDLIMIDRGLPKMTGKELYQEILNKQIQSQLIVISSYPEDADWNKEIEAGRVYYLQKPFSPNKIISLVDSLLKSE